MDFKIATWNMDHWKRPKSLAKESWEFLDSLNTDVALVQEAKPLVEDKTVVFQKISRHRPWGSAVYSKKWKLNKITKARSKYLDSRNRFYEEGVDLLNTHAGVVAIAQVELPFKLPNRSPLIVISCYGMIDNAYAQTTMFRIIADLIPLFDDLNLGRNVILAGDLNIGTQQKSDMGERKRHQAILQSIESLGLFDCLERTKDSRKSPETCPCPHSPNCGHVVTYHNGLQLDYIFATESLIDYLKRCYVLNDQTDEQNKLPYGNGKRKFSDHCPVIAEFEF